MLLPIYKSFSDFFVLTYVLHHYEIEQPFTFGNLEDKPRITLFDKWMSYSGYIHSRRNVN